MSSVQALKPINHVGAREFPAAERGPRAQDRWDAALSTLRTGARSIESALFEGNTCRTGRVWLAALCFLPQGRAFSPRRSTDRGAFWRRVLRNADLTEAAKPALALKAGLRFDGTFLHGRSCTASILSEPCCRGSDKSVRSIGWFRNVCTELATDLFGLASNFERRNVRPENFGGSARRRLGRPALWSARVRAVGGNQLVS